MLIYCIKQLDVVYLYDLKNIVIHVFFILSRAKEDRILHQVTFLKLNQKNAPAELNFSVD